MLDRMMDNEGSELFDIDDIINSDTETVVFNTCNTLQKGTK